MKVEGLLSQLSVIKERAEEGEVTQLEIIDLLVTFINNARIREAVDEICF
jgi:hypothetical protein